MNVIYLIGIILIYQRRNHVIGWEFQANSEITIKIPEGNVRYILSSVYNNLPNELYVNNNNKEVKKSLTLTEQDNNIRMIWFSPITNCSYMFQSTSIKTVDF